MRPVLLAALAVLLAACDSTDLVDGPVGALVVTETPDGLLIETEDDYPCANYPLVVDIARTQSRVTVDVVGVEETESCLTALGPARVVVPYPESAAGSNATYEAVLRKDGETDRYRGQCGVVGCGFAPIDPPTFSRVGPR